MDSLITRERTEAKKKGVYAAAAWGARSCSASPAARCWRFPPRSARGTSRASGSCSARSTESGSEPTAARRFRDLPCPSRQGTNDAERSLRSASVSCWFWRVASAAAAVATRSATAPGGGGGWDTMVDRSKPLSDLTPAELTKICQDLAPNLTSVSCDLAGFISAGYAAAYDQSLTDEQIQAACTQTSNTCQSQQPPADCSGASTAPADCTATVDEYFTCIDDTLAQIPACGSADAQAPERRQHLAVRPDLLHHAGGEVPRAGFDLAGSSGRRLRRRSRANIRVASGLRL